MRPPLTILAPSHNEEAVIAAFCERVLRVLDSLSERYDSTLLIVDDSTDSTQSVLREIAARDDRIHVLGLSRSFGHQAALLAGLDSADADAVIMLDCDLQHPPELIPQLLAEYENGFDVVNTVRSDAPNTGRIKRSLSRLYYKGFRWLSDIDMDDGSADFRLLSRRVVRLFQTQIREKNLFLRGLVPWIGFHSTSVRYRAADRAAGASKYTMRRRLRLGVNGVVGFSKRPLIYSFVTGLVVATLGVAYAIVSLVAWLTDAAVVPGWTSLAVAVSIFSGVQLLFIGIVGLYVGAVFDEVKQRPTYIIADHIHSGAPRNIEPRTDPVPDGLQSGLRG